MWRVWLVSFWTSTPHLDYAVLTSTVCSSSGSSRTAEHLVPTAVLHTAYSSTCAVSSRSAQSVSQSRQSAGRANAALPSAPSSPFPVPDLPCRPATARSCISGSDLPTGVDSVHTAEIKERAHFNHDIGPACQPHTTSIPSPVNLFGRHI